MKGKVNIESEEVYDCIVIGGGISGISFAHYLQSIGKSVLILEKTERAGGQVYSYSTQGYWRELGAHTCYNSYTRLLGIVKDIDELNSVLPIEKGGYKLYNKGKIKGMFSEISLFQLFLNGAKLFFSSKENKTVKEYFRPIVGKSNYDNVFSNLFKAVICQPADNYPAELFLKRRSGRMKELPRKFSFPQGLSSLIDLIIEKDKLLVEKSKEVSNLTEQDSILKIETKQGHCYYAKNVALACPPPIAGSILKGVNNDLSNLLRSIPLFHSESINITVNKDKIEIGKIAGIIPISDPFMSVVSRDLVNHPDLRSFTFHFEKEIISPQKQIETICRILNISESDILEQEKVAHILPALNASHLHMSKQVAKIQTENIYLLGNYFFGLSLEDCVHRSSIEFERFKENCN